MPTYHKARVCGICIRHQYVFAAVVWHCRSHQYRVGVPAIGTQINVYKRGINTVSSCTRHVPGNGLVGARRPGNSRIRRCYYKWPGCIGHVYVHGIGIRFAAVKVVIAYGKGKIKCTAYRRYNLPLRGKVIIQNIFYAGHPAVRRCS